MRFTPIKESAMKKFFLGSTLLAAAVTAATPSDASTMAASAGYAYFPADESCFARDWGRINSPCFDMRRYWDIPVENPGFTGNKTFSAFGASCHWDANVSFSTVCAAIVLGHSGGTPGASKWTLFQALSTETFNPGRWTTLGTLPIAADETVLYECAITGLNNGGGPTGFVGQVKGF
jgi:hypothetical protein